MTNLVDLLRKIELLPDTSFRQGALPSERTQEISLLDSVLPLMVSNEASRVLRACRRQDDCLMMHYQIRNGSFHDIWITYSKELDDVTMTVNGKWVAVPASTEELASLLKGMIEEK